MTIPQTRQWKLKMPPYRSIGHNAEAISFIQTLDMQVLNKLHGG